MARFAQTVESSAAIGSGVTFANLVANTAAGFKLRKIRLGLIYNTTTPNSQQITIGVYRATARGTATNFKTGIQNDPNSPVSAITGLDTQWSVNPTLALTNLMQITFNSLAGYEIPLEGIDELVCSLGTANGLAFVNMDNAIPSGHKLVLEVIWEE